MSREKLKEIIKIALRFKIEILLTGKYYHLDKNKVLNLLKFITLEVVRQRHNNTNDIRIVLSEEHINLNEDYFKFVHDVLEKQELKYIYKEYTLTFNDK